MVAWGLPLWAGYFGGRAVCWGEICEGWAHWVFGVCTRDLGVVFAGVVRCSVVVGGVCVCLCVCLYIYIYIYRGFQFLFFSRFLLVLMKLLSLKS